MLCELEELIGLGWSLILFVRWMSSKEREELIVKWYLRSRSFEFGNWRFFVCCEFGDWWLKGWIFIVVRLWEMKRRVLLDILRLGLVLGRSVLEK